MLFVNPHFNFSLDGANNSDDGVSQDSPSQETFEAIMAVLSVEVWTRVLKSARCWARVGNMVLGEEGIIFSLKLKQSFNGGWVELDWVGTRVHLEVDFSTKACLRASRTLSTRGDCSCHDGSSINGTLFLWFCAILIVHRVYMKWRQWPLTESLYKPTN